MVIAVSVFILKELHIIHHIYAIYSENKIRKANIKISDYDIHYDDNHKILYSAEPNAQMFGMTSSFFGLSTEFYGA